MAIDRGKLLETVDSSGFLFQVKVAQQFRESGLSPVLEEQHWVHPNGKYEGFADIVAISNRLRFVVECKRFRDAEWIFLTQERSFSQNRNIFYKISKYDSSNYPFRKWSEFGTHQKNIKEANQCVMKRNGKDENLLESICTILINSIEAIAQDEIQIRKDQRGELIYIPMIVTTARLYLCEYNLNIIDINTGNLSINEISPTLESVPYIRFRKSLGIRSNELVDSSSLKHLSLANERSILIIQAESLKGFLNSLESLIVPTENE
jgi:hypothetical protein